MKKISLFLTRLILLVLMLSSLHVSAGEQARMQVQFCDDGEDKSTNSTKIGNIVAGEKRELCIVLRNMSDQTIVVTNLFVDGVSNPQLPQFLICKNEEDSKESFSKYAWFEDEKGNKLNKSTFEIGPLKQMVYHAYYQFPQGFSGMAYGCLITTTGVQEIVEGKLNIMLRRGSNIWAQVIGDIKVAFGFTNMKDRNNESTDNDIETLFQDENISLLHDKTLDTVYGLVGVTNTGNVKQDLILTGSVTNKWGFNMAISDKASVMPGETKDLRIEVRNMPIYKLGYDVDLNISYKPVFEFQVENVSDKDKAGGEKTIKASFFIFPTELAIKIGTYIFIILAVIIGLIIFFVVKKRKYEAAKIDYTVRAGDTLNTIADNYACDWQDIAKENKIEAPYALSMGQKIKVFDFRNKI